MFKALRVIGVVGVLGLLAAVPVPIASAARTESFIVVLAPGGVGPRAEATRLTREYGGQIGHVYTHALRGFSVRTSPAAASALARSPRVAYVERDGLAEVADQTTPTGVARIFASANPAIDIDKTDDVRVDVDVAVIDTGIDLTHPDLNVVGSVSCLVSPCAGTGDDDQHHGTHVAGTIGALDNGIGVVGVAPGARLWAVKVLDSSGNGPDSGVIAGIDWVVAHNASAPSQAIEVINLSLITNRMPSMDAAVHEAVNKGITVVAAAGNNSADASLYSPAGEPSALTVSALADFNGLAGGGAGWTCYPDTDDTFVNYSNFGTVVDLIAPGMCINSTSPGGLYQILSGTSMAAPHVAGAAALLRSTGKGVLQTEQVLKSTGNLGWSGNPDGVQEPLLDVSTFSPTLVATTTPPPPTAQLAFAGSATAQKSSWTATVAVSGSSPGTVISGAWSPAGTPSGCTAGADGRCAIVRSGLSKRTSTVTWTHTATGSTVTILKP